MRRYLFELAPDARPARDVLPGGVEVREADGHAQVIAGGDIDRALPGSGVGWILLESSPVTEGKTGWEAPEARADIEARRKMAALAATPTEPDPEAGHQPDTAPLLDTDGQGEPGKDGAGNP